VFAALDETLAAWLKRHGLFLKTEYRDRPVRAVTVVDDAGDTYSIWFAPHAGATEIRAQFWPRKRADRRTWSGMYSDEALWAGLEDAYNAVLSG
jgi:hypothetical protein